MRKLLIATAFILLPLAGMAETTANAAETQPYGWGRIMWVSAGVIGSAFLMDWLIGGPMTAPAVSIMHPAIQQAQAAGAVFGEHIAAATAIRDNQARAAMLYAVLVGTGAWLGGWIVDTLVVGQPAPQTATP